MLGIAFAGEPPSSNLQVAWYGGEANPTLMHVRSERASWRLQKHARLDKRLQTGWWRISVSSNTTPADAMMLSFSDAFDSTLTLFVAPDYQPQPGRLFDPEHEQLGSRQRLSFKLHRAALQAPIYLMVQGGRAQPIQMELETETQFANTDRNWVRFNVIVQFGLLLLALISAGQAIALRQWSILYLSAWCLSASVQFMGISGEIAHLPFGRWLLPHGMFIYYAMALLAGMQIFWYWRQFLDLNLHLPRVDSLIKMLLATLLLCFFALLLTGNAHAWIGQAGNTAVFACQSVILVSAAWLALKGHRNARFYLVTTTPLAIVTIVRIAGFALGEASPAWVNYLFPIAMLATGILIILMLALRSRQRDNERLIAYQRANSDSLTGLYNRLALEQQLRLLFSQTALPQRPLIALFFDLDHFKKINDSFGHEVGDHALVAFGKAVQGELRKTDFFARLGGEEFVLLVEGVDLDYAVRFAERLRLVVLNKCATIAARPIGLTVSIGVAARDAQTKAPEDLLRQADTAAYRAKQSGRNRVVRFGDFSDLLNPSTPQ